MPLGQVEAKIIIHRYRSAYEAANGKSLYSVWYDRGWFNIREVPHGYTVKKRRKEIEVMTATLRDRKTEAA